MTDRKIVKAGASGAGAKVTSFVCGAGNQNCECCNGPFASIFCCGLCVFCCEICTLTYEIGQAGSPPPEAAVPPSRPVVVPVDPGTGGVGPGVPQFTASAFGAGLPIVFGSDRLPGNVFWHSGFTRKEVSKSNGETLFYYTTDFAVGICEGEIDAVLRMWLGDALVIDNSSSVDENGIIQPSADGYIFGATIDVLGADSPLRGANIAKTKVSAHNGSPYQLPQGVYARKKGFDDTPGYRGVAYLLFENFVIAEGTIPTVTAEVTANTQNLYPRLYGTRPLEDTIFNRVRETLLYDPGYDTYYIAMDHNATSRKGYVSFNGNNLDPFIEHDWVTDNTWEEANVNNLEWQRAWVMRSGAIVHCVNNVDSGELVVSANPFANVIVDTRGRIVSGFSGHSVDGFSLLGRGSITVTGPGLDGTFRDIIVGISAPAVTNNSVGFMEVDDNDQLIMRGFFNGVTGGTAGRLVAYDLGAADIEDTPLFSDGQTTNCKCVFSFTYDTNEINEFSVDRFIYAGAGATIQLPIHDFIGTIDFASIGGDGFTHTIVRAFVDPSDNMIVLMVYSASRGSFFVKWNPFTAAVVYAKKMPSSFSSIPSQADATEIMTSSKFAWISQDNKIYTTDLSTGTTTLLVENFGDQELPTPRAVENAFYNGLENSLVYLSDTVGKEITKVFLERFSRNSVTLAEITRQLLRRVGWIDEGIDVTDLQALSVIGYTIHNPKDLRAIFSELRQVFRFDLIESNGKILYKTRGSAPSVNIDIKYFADDNGEGHLKEINDVDFAHLRKLNLTYRDIDREYNTNVQSIFLPKYQNTVLDNDAAIEVDVPVVLTADSAKKLAEILLYSKTIYQRAYEGILDPRFQNLDPGDVVNVLDGDTTITMRLRDVGYGQDKVVRISASKEDPDIYNDQVNLFGNVGSFQGDEFDRIEQRIDPYVMPIPFRNRAEAAAVTNRHYMFLTFLNTRTTVLFNKPITLNINGTSTIAVPPPSNYPTWGVVVTPPIARTSLFSTDRKSQLRVRMFSTTGAALNSVTKDELLANSGVNLAIVGGELIQFQNVVDEGEGFYTFTGLHRCRFGTEGEAFRHVPGEKFVLLADNLAVLDTGSVRRIDLPTADGPKRAAQVFINSNNPFQPSPTKQVISSNLRPWAPSGGKGEYVGDDCVISWSYRTRYDGQYPDDGSEQVPFNDGTEEYTLYLLTDPSQFSFNNPASYLRKLVLTNVSEYTYDAASQTADGFDNLNDTLYVRVYQSGNLTGVDTGQGAIIAVSHKR